MPKSCVISKTDFVRYTMCPLYSWLYKNRRDLIKDQKPSRILEQGNAVEEISHQLFEKGVEVQDNYQKGADRTKELMESGTNVIYQATTLTDRYLCRADILVRDKDGESWHLYEVKSSTKVKPEHYADICFQLNVFTETGIQIKSTSIILVNNEYIYDEKAGLEAKKILKIQDLTGEIEQKLPEYQPQMEQAHKVLTSAEEPKVTVLLKKLKYDPPQAFQDYYYKDRPDYSIYDVNKLWQSKVAKLAAKGIMKIEDIPDDYFPSAAMNMQVQLTKQKTSFIDKEAIKEALAALEYPLYFLDYETINPAIPMFDGTHPYQQIPMQSSLHIIDGPGAKIRHAEYLHTGKGSAVPLLLKFLERHIGGVGSVIVWNKYFEAMCNRGMGKNCPEYREFLESINSRLYDLMLIFKDKYLDYRFKGSTSIKMVIPVLIPELAYADLEIQEGGTASDAIFDLIEGKVAEGDREKMIEDLKKYCARDTLTMVELYRFLILI